MTIARLNIALYFAALVLGAPAQASDFRQIADPRFARSLLITAPRQLQVDCAGLALHRSETGAVSGEAANRLADAVGRRLGIDVADPIFARNLIEDRAAGHADPTKTDRVWAELRRDLEAKCASLFAAASKSQADVEAALGPVPTEPRELPNAEQCLAVARYAEETGAVEWSREMGELLQSARIERAGPDERAAREKTVATGIDFLRSKQTDGDRLEIMSVACLPAVTDAAKELALEQGEPTGR